MREQTEAEKEIGLRALSSERKTCQSFPTGPNVSAASLLPLCPDPLNMSPAEEKVITVAEMITGWRIQDLYYTIITTEDEVSIIYPQKRPFGKALFMAIRYGTFVYIALRLASAYGPAGTVRLTSKRSSSKSSCYAFYTCKDDRESRAVKVYWWLTKPPCISHSSRATVLTLCLCLCALLRTRKCWSFAVILLSAGPSCVRMIMTLVNLVQYPAEAITSLDVQLGYPCYAPIAQRMIESTVYGAGRQFRGPAHGQLVRVLQRDGGIYYISLAVMRCAVAVMDTPPVVSVSVLCQSGIDKQPLNIFRFSVWSQTKVLQYTISRVINALASIAAPIFAQRLMLNIRSVDYMGSRPFASTILFARTPQSSEDTMDNTVLGAYRLSLNLSAGRCEGRFTANKKENYGEDELQVAVRKQLSDLSPGVWIPEAHAVSLASSTTLLGWFVAQPVPRLLGYWIGLDSLARVPADICLAVSSD
ncbi:hypothetical protein NMY22_g9767 [Coprinellus aureogranulatus]|nr:hypothetical protein NMY22_g9767 [Coprinellus aureogranulatus]